MNMNLKSYRESVESKLNTLTFLNDSEPPKKSMPTRKKQK